MQINFAFEHPESKKKTPFHHQSEVIPRAYKNTHVQTLCLDVVYAVTFFLLHTHIYIIVLTNCLYQFICLPLRSKPGAREQEWVFFPPFLLVVSSCLATHALAGKAGHDNRGCLLHSFHWMLSAARSLAGPRGNKKRAHRDKQIMNRCWLA